ncbi:unnamed protein product [Vitrella brassicaformis CCMP3155]|uniref:Thioredoxin domain-containing protein n=1 Tax=Vitrella brassicaformis (strain CCMP3155) TaxID=1169540 RepID=A0A0G4ERN1_VITBC|nr:unnamed protein product [Vitrella brassicaformis CCMP3155]|eukprot:CEM00532.1 unnamed protein product [Vitrella brassicaformis CCMP3155]
MKRPWKRGGKKCCLIQYLDPFGRFRKQTQFTERIDADSTVLLLLVLAQVTSSRVAFHASVHENIVKRGPRYNIRNPETPPCQAPDFVADAVLPDGSFDQVSLSSFKGKKYVVLFFYPLDFTFVCPSEIVAFDQKIAEFQSRNVEVIGCSIDSKFVHHAWRDTPLNKGGIGPIKYTLLADVKKELADKYQVLLPSEGVALRGLFLIDKQGVVRHAVINDLPLGRSVDEALRMVDALQHHESVGEVCPANWTKGAKGMKPTSEGVASYLPTMK